MADSQPLVILLFVSFNFLAPSSRGRPSGHPLAEIDRQFVERAEVFSTPLGGFFLFSSAQWQFERGKVVRMKTNPAVKADC